MVFISKESKCSRGVGFVTEDTGLKYLLKLFKKDRVCFDGLDYVDHHFYVSGKTRRLKYDLVEDNTKENELTFWILKHSR